MVAGSEDGSFSVWEIVVTVNKNNMNNETTDYKIVRKNENAHSGGIISVALSLKNDSSNSNN